jgi:RNA polymerase sigma factor (sigma-70 family)
MNQESQHRRLCSIATLWGLVCDAHGGTAEAAQAAQRQLLARYGGAIRRYLLASLRDEEGAEDLFQEFALHFLNGDYRNADPRRGRFRDYVKTILFHLIAKHHKSRQRRPQALPSDHPEPAVEAPECSDRDPVFLASWRDDLLARCWAALSQAEARGGQPYYTVLRFQADHPGTRSPQLAEQLGPRLGKQLTAPAVRQLLHRAREKLANLLVEEVAHSLGNPTDEQLEQEFEDLGLLEHCRPALERRGKG